MYNINIRIQSTGPSGVSVLPLLLFLELPYLSSVQYLNFGLPLFVVAPEYRFRGDLGLLTGLNGEVVVEGDQIPS
jgi:hypothetical protein